MEQVSLHKKIECYLFEYQERYLGFKIIDKETICDLEQVKGGRKIKAFKLDLLGADEYVFYMIEIKTGKLTMKHIEKYEKAFYNFNYLHRGINIVFVAKLIDKKAQEFIEKTRRYKLIFINQLKGLDTYIPKDIKINSSTIELDEYRISFLLKVFFPWIRKYTYMQHAKFGNTYLGKEYSMVGCALKNGYYIEMHIDKKNLIFLEVEYLNKSIMFPYPFTALPYFNNILYQIVYMQKLIKKIAKLENKMITWEEFKEICDIVTKYTYDTMKNRYDEYKNIFTEIMKTISRDKNIKYHV